MEESKQQEVINLRNIIHTIIVKRRKFYLPLGITFVLAAVYIFSQPRFYTTSAKLAPEAESSLSGGTLSSIASSFGFDLGNMQSADAINPLLYPTLMEDNAFVARLFTVNVTSSDGSVNTNYYNYLDKFQKKTWWSGATNWFMNLFKKKNKAGINNGNEFNPYLPSERQSNIISKIQGNVTLSMDKKTGVITVNVKDQDPLVCKTLTDSIIVQLQDFITAYRTSKARGDVAYYSELAESARSEYMEASMRYSRAADSNRNSILESYRTQLTNLENDMQLKYNSYTMVMTQLQAAKAKVQERTPAFTILKGAEMPIRPAGPKRVMFVFSTMFLVFMVSALWLVRKEIHLKF